MNNYCITSLIYNINETEKNELSFFNLFHILFYVKKIKIDYAMFPVEEVDEDENYISFKSKLSNDFVGSFKKHKKNLERIEKKNGKISYSLIIETEDDDFSKIEKQFLPVFEKKFLRKIPFKIFYKRKLKLRFKTINQSI